MTGFRMMQLAHDGTVRSDYAPAETLDADGVFTARCRDHPHHAPPVASCSCGVYVTDSSAPLTDWIAANEHREFWQWMVVCEGVLHGPVLDDPDMPVWPQTVNERAAGTPGVRCFRGARFTVTAIHHDPRAHSRASKAAHRYRLPLQPLNLLEAA